MSDENKTTNTKSNEETSNLVATGQLTIEGSQINQVTQVDRIETMNFHASTQMDNANIQHINLQGTCEMTNANIGQVIMNETHYHHHNTYNVQSDVGTKFEEEQFAKYLKEFKILFGDMIGTRILATFEMMSKIPTVVQTTLKDGMKTMGAKRSTDLFDLFPDGIPMEALIAFIGKPGSGKSVLTKLIQMYFIHHGYFPFHIVFKDIVAGKDMSFAKYLETYGYTDYPINNSESFGEWIHKNPRRIIFILDGLDEAPFNLRANVRSVNIREMANAHIWTVQLMSKSIMKDSMVIFTSRLSSIVNLPISLKPDTIYCLDGLDSGSMESVVNLYNKEDADSIISLINRKSTKENSFIRSPFAVSLIAATYKETSLTGNDEDTTLTSLYAIAFNEREYSIHNRSCGSDGTEEENQHGGQDLVDKFFLTRFMENQLDSFTAADVKKFGFTTEQIENFSFVNVGCKRNAHLIADTDKMIEPSHLTITEFHCARALLKGKNVEDFKRAVDDLFVLEDQDRKMMIRRFISGLISSTHSDEEKQKIFLEKLTRELMAYLSEDISLKYKGDEYWQASKLQGYLLNDLAELPAEMMKIIRTKFAYESELIMDIILTNVSLLNGIINFLQKVDPHVYCLRIYLSEDVTIDDFSNIVDSVVNLTKKVNQMSLREIGNFATSDVLKKLIVKVELSLTLSYLEDVDDRKINEIKTTLQQEMNNHTNLEMFVELEHRGRLELLRHRRYTDTDSSSAFILTSSHGGKTMNLSRKICPNIKHEISENKFDFMLSEAQEVNKLSHLVATHPSIHIYVLCVYLPLEIHKTCTKELCKNLRALKKKVHEIRMFNLDKSCFDLDDIQMLMEKAEYNLTLFFLDEISPSTGDELERKLTVVHKSKTPGLYLDVRFKNYDIEILALPTSSTSQTSEPLLFPTSSTSQTSEPLPFPTSSTSQTSEPLPFPTSSTSKRRKQRHRKCIIS